MNSRPSWSSKLNSSYCPTQDTSYWLNSSSLHQTYFPTYLVYLEEEAPEEVLPAIIPCSDLTQHADNCLDTVCVMLLNPLAPTDFLEYGICGLLHYASKFFLLDGKLMHQNLQGCHKVVIPREKCFSLITQAHEVVGHRAIFSMLSNLWKGFGGPCWMKM